jgi:hypothetical protein
LTAVKAAVKANTECCAFSVIEGRNVYSDLHALSTLSYKLFLFFSPLAFGFFRAEDHSDHRLARTAVHRRRADEAVHGAIFNAEGAGLF